MSSKQKVIGTGAVTVVLGGFSASLTADDARQWLELLTQYAPILLCIWLGYSLWIMQRQHRNCEKELREVHRELSAVWQAIAVENKRPSEDIKREYLPASTDDSGD